jgi:hypothetical protein
LHIGMYDSSDRRLYLYVYLITSLGTLLHDQTGIDVPLS